MAPGADLGGKSSILLSLSSIASFGANLAQYAAQIELHAFPTLLLVTAFVAVAA